MEEVELLSTGKDSVRMLAYCLNNDMEFQDLDSLLLRSQILEKRLVDSLTGIYQKSLVGFIRKLNASVKVEVVSLFILVVLKSRKVDLEIAVCLCLICILYIWQRGVYVLDTILLLKNVTKRGTPASMKFLHSMGSSRSWASGVKYYC